MADFIDAWERYLPSLSPAQEGLQGQQGLQPSIPDPVPPTEYVVPPANDNLPQPARSKVRSFDEYKRMSDAEREAYHSHNSTEDVDRSPVEDDRFWEKLGARF